MATVSTFADQNFIPRFEMFRDFTFRIDASKISGGMTSSNVYQLITLPAGFVLTGGSVNVVSADTGSSTRTLDLGDGVDADGLIDGLDTKTTGIIPFNGAHSGKTAALFQPYVLIYSAADTIDITPVQTITDLILDIHVLGYFAGSKAV